MANVKFPDFIEGVSGTLSTIKYTDGTKRKIIVTHSKSGKQRLYLRDYKTRTAPVTDNELKARGKFAEAAQFYSNLTDEQKEAYSLQWRKNKYRLNGKKYGTLRGYIVALFYMSKA